MGRTFWTRVNSRREIRTSVALLAMVGDPDSIWKRLFITSVSVATGRLSAKIKKQSPSIAGDVM
jgi:hypothetical protein